MDKAKAKVYGVIALKGGVGKTSVVANLGASLVNDFQKKVLLVDANFSTPHLGLHLGIINPKYSLHPVLNNKYSIYESIYQHPIGLHIIPGTLAPEVANPLSLKEKIEPLKDIYDVILIDSSPSLNDEMYATMAASDELLVVSSPDYPTLSATLQAINLAKRKNVPIRGIIINKVRKKKFELTSKEIAKTSEVDVLATLPDDVNVLASLSEMQPVTTYRPYRDVSVAFKKLAASLVDEKYRSLRMFSRARQAIGEKLSRKKQKEVN
jgi:septum site-determining protein MinD